MNHAFYGVCCCSVFVFRVLLGNPYYTNYTFQGDDLRRPPPRWTVRYDSIIAEPGPKWKWPSEQRQLPQQYITSSKTKNTIAGGRGRSWAVANGRGRSRTVVNARRFHM